MGFAQDMGVWRCTDCNEKLKDPYYIGDDMVCKDCHQEYKAGEAKKYISIMLKLKDSLADLDRVMDNDESGYDMSAARIRLNDAIEHIDWNLENQE